MESLRQEGRQGDSDSAGHAVDRIEEPPHPPTIGASVPRRPRANDYERRIFPMEEPDPVAAIKFRLEQAGMEPKDLVPILGSRSRVSEILNHKRRRRLGRGDRTPSRRSCPATDLFQFQLGGVRGDNAVVVTFAKNGSARLEDVN